MNIERLRAFRGVQREIEEIQREIATLYYPITSPNGRESLGQRGNSPSDPTAAAVATIMRLEARLEDLTIQLSEELKAIEVWLEELDDHELRAIIRAHYLLGDSWKRCTQRILNYDFSDTAKKRVYRYFGIIK